MIDNEKAKKTEARITAFVKKEWIKLLFILLIAISIVIAIYTFKTYNPYTTIVLLYLWFFIPAVLLVVLLGGLGIKHHLARKIEVFGYIVLFTLLAVSFYISDDSQLMTRAMNLENKTDYVFHYISASSESEQRRIEADYCNTYNSSVQRKDWLAQEELNRKISTALKLLSTACIAIGRFDDINSKMKEENEEPRTSE